MAKINKATAGIMLAAVIGGGAIGASAIPVMAADFHQAFPAFRSPDRVHAGHP